MSSNALDLVGGLEQMAMTIGNSALTEGGLDLLVQLIADNHQGHFADRHWSVITEALVRIFELYLPTNSLDEAAAKASSHPASPALLPYADTNASTATISFPAELQEGVNGAVLRTAEPTGIHLIARQCSLQLLFLELMRALLVKSPESSIIGPGSTLPVASLNHLMGLLLRSYEFALSFNANLLLRETMVQAGFAKTVEELVLNRQETGAVLLSIEALFLLYRQGLHTSDQLPALANDRDALLGLTARYFDVSTAALRRYVELRLPNKVRRRTGRAWSEVVSLVLSQWRMLVDILDDKSEKDKDLSLAAEKNVERQMAVALEVFAAVDRASPIVASAREFILASTGRLCSRWLEAL